MRLLRPLPLIAALAIFVSPVHAAEGRGHSVEATKKSSHKRSEHRRSQRRKRARHRRRAQQEPRSTAEAAPGSIRGLRAEVAEAVAVDPLDAEPPTKAAESSSDLVWSDEFGGPAGAPPDPTKWNFDVGGNGWGNEELQYYTARPGNASLDGNGDLAIIARAERYRGADGVERDYTSARLQTLEKVEFTYGLLEARIQVPSGQGLAPAFWTLGDEAYEGDDGQWPQCGEIDAMEVLGSEPNVLNGTLHGLWPSAPHGIGDELRLPNPLSAGFHTYGVEWKPESISFLLDGSVYATVSREALAPGDQWPFQHPNFLLLNLAVGGEWPGSPDASTEFPARMLVDWVRIYR